MNIILVLYRLRGGSEERSKPRVLINMISTLIKVCIRCQGGSEEQHTDMGEVGERGDSQRKGDLRRTERLKTEISPDVFKSPE